MKMPEFFSNNKANAIALAAALAASPNLNAENVVDKLPEDSKNKIEYQEEQVAKNNELNETTVTYSVTKNEGIVDIEKTTPGKDKFIQEYHKANPGADSLAFKKTLEIIDSAIVEFKHRSYYYNLREQLSGSKKDIVGDNLSHPEKVTQLFQLAREGGLDITKCHLFEAEHISEKTSKHLELVSALSDSLTKEKVFGLVTSEYFKKSFSKEGSVEQYCDFVKQDVFTDFNIEDFNGTEKAFDKFTKVFGNDSLSKEFFEGITKTTGGNFKFQFNKFEKVLELYEHSKTIFTKTLTDIVSLKKRTIAREDSLFHDNLISAEEIVFYDNSPERFTSLYEDALVTERPFSYLSPYALPSSEIFKICLDYFSAQPFTTLTDGSRKELIVALTTSGKITSKKDIYSVAAVCFDEPKPTEELGLSNMVPENTKAVIENLNKKEYTDLAFKKFYIEIMVEIHPILNTILNNLQHYNIHKYVHNFLEDPLFTKIDFKKFSQYYEEINPLKTGVNEEETNDLKISHYDDQLITARNLVSLDKELTKENVKFTYELLVQTRKDSALMSKHIINKENKVAILAHNETEEVGGVVKNRFANNEFLETYRKLALGGVTEIRDTSNTVDPVVSTENFKKLKEEILSIVEGNKDIVVVDDGHGFARGLEMKSGGYGKGEVIGASDILEAVKRNSTMNKESRLTFIFNACEAASFVTGNGGIQDTIMNHNKYNPTNQLPLPIIITQGEIGQPTWSNPKVPTFNELTEFFKKGNPTYQDLVNFNLEYFKTTRSNLTFWIPMKVMIDGKWVEVYFQLASNIEADEYSNVG